MQMLPALLTRGPQTGLRHPLTQGLLADPDPVTLGQLLAGKRRAEVMIVFTHDIQNRIAKGFRITPIARTAALLRDKSATTFTIISLQQAVHMAAADRQKPGSVADTQPVIFEPPPGGEALSGTS